MSQLAPPNKETSDNGYERHEMECISPPIWAFGPNICCKEPTKHSTDCAHKRHVTEGTAPSFSRREVCKKRLQAGYD